MSLLFKEVDTEKTIDRVCTFLKKDLERLLLQSGHRLTDLKSPRLSSMPGGSHANHVEDIIIDGVNAEAEIQAIHATIHHLPETSRIIMLGMFVDHHQWFQVSQRIYSGTTTLWKKRRLALLEFADGFDYWQRVYHCEPVQDLHRYKEGKQKGEIIAKE